LLVLRGLQVLIDTLEPKLSLGEAKWSMIVPWLYVVKIDGAKFYPKDYNVDSI